MRQSWTDERLDEFGRRIDERFDRVDERFGDIDVCFRQVDERFDRPEVEMDQRFNRVEAEIKYGNRALRADFDALRNENHALQMTMIRVGGAVIVALMGLLIAGQV